MYKLYLLKRQLEDVAIFPFILIGRLIARFYPLKQEFETYFFFSFYHTGGAEKVHALITKAVGNLNCVIYFTRQSTDKNFYDEFASSGCVIKEIANQTDNKFLYFLNLIQRGIISSHINRQHKKPIVFNGQCNFGYKISPWIRSSIPQVELIHSYNTFSLIRIPFLPFITSTVMISKLKIEEHLVQYQRLNVPSTFNAKIEYIINGISLPATKDGKDFCSVLKVLYVGRGTEEKRIHLIAQIAKQVHDNGLPVVFEFMGDVQNAIPADLQMHCALLGHQTDENVIASIYKEAHIVIITSTTEGFPMVIMEGMAHQCAVVATAVGDIPVHIKHGENGFIFSSVNDESAIVKEAAKFIETLNTNRELLKHIGTANSKYAFNNFGLKKFNNSYKQLFNRVRKN